MPISYAGVPLLLDTGEVQAFLDSTLTLEDLRDLGAQPAAVAGGRYAGKLALPNYPAPPRVKLNSLYCPTGAARWARGYFLANTSAVKAIEDAVGGTNSAATLSIGDGHETGEFAMHLLPPRPVSPRFGSEWSNDPSPSPDGEKLWIVPLVDARYFWQFRNTGQPSTATWAALETALAARVGMADFGMDDEIAEGAGSIADYYLPDAGSFGRQYDNAALAIDALAHSLGMRIVSDSEGFVLRSGTAYEERFSGTNRDAGPMMAGGDFNRVPVLGAETPPGLTPDDLRGQVPEFVSVVFRKKIDGVLSETERHVVTTAASTFGYFQFTAGANRTIHTTAIAIYTGATPNNSSDCTTLATRIARDFYYDVSRAYDVTAAGIVNFQPSAHDDAIEYTLGRIEGGAEEGKTRIWSAGYNFGVELMNHQFAATNTPDPEPEAQALDIFEMIDTLAEGQSGGATAYRLEIDASGNWNRVSPAEVVTIYAADVGDSWPTPFAGVAFGTDAGLDRGDFVTAFRSETANRWYAVAGGLTHLFGVASGAIAQDATGTIAITERAGDSRTLEITATAISAITSGGRCLCDWNGEMLRWEAHQSAAGDEDPDPPPADCCSEGGGGPGNPGQGPGLPGGNGGFPDGVQCDRSECCESDEQLTIEDCSTPCPDDAPESYVVKIGDLECCDEAAGDHVLRHDTGCTWKSDPFQCGAGEDEGTYQWVLVVSEDPYRSTLTLTWVSDANTMPRIVYAASAPWCCACENVMTLDCPRHVKDGCPGTTWHVCVKPGCDLDCDPNDCIEPEEAAVSACEECPDGAPTEFTVTFPEADCCDGLAGTHTLAKSEEEDCLWTSTGITCGESTYRLELTIVAGVPELRAALDSGDAIDGMAFLYRADTFECLCRNLLFLEAAVDCGGIPPAVCIVPVSDGFCAGGAWLDMFEDPNGTLLSATGYGGDAADWNVQSGKAVAQIALNTGSWATFTPTGAPTEWTATFRAILVDDPEGTLVAAYNSYRFCIVDPDNFLELQISSIGTISINQWVGGFDTTLALETFTPENGKIIDVLLTRESDGTITCVNSASTPDTLVGAQTEHAAATGMALFSYLDGADPPEAEYPKFDALCVQEL